MLIKKQNSVISNEQQHEVKAKKRTFNTECEDITRKIKKLKDTMVTYFLTIHYVLSSDSKVLTRVIPTMERAQGLLAHLKLYLIANRFLPLGCWSLFSLST
jgi:hypothetical protein